jgi:leader peptidase (prepilin peptidase)/N-methyltransferase
MNGSFVAMWTAVGLVASAVVTPTAAWLAGKAQQRRYRMATAGIMTAAFLLTALRCSTSSELLIQSVFVSVAVLLAIVDVLDQRLPRSLIWPTCVAVTGILVAETIRSDNPAGLLRAITAAAALASGYLAIAVTSRGGLGAGDVRLAVLVGGVLGQHGWDALVVGTTLGFVTTGAAVILLAVGRRMPSTLPHGPGMLAGAFVALLF